MERLKAFALVCATGAFLLFIAACGSGGSKPSTPVSGSAPASQANEPVKTRFVVVRLAAGATPAEGMKCDPDSTCLVEIPEAEPLESGIERISREVSVEYAEPVYHAVIDALELDNEPTP